MIPFMFLVLAAASMAMLSVAVAWGATSALYSSPLMCALWALCAASSLTLFVKRRIWKHPAVMLIHVALILILIGGAVTHFDGSQGMVSLRVGGEEISEYVDDEDGEKIRLPFALSAVAYETIYYPNTAIPSGFHANLQIKTPTNEKEDFQLSINKPVEKKGYKFVLKSVDGDGGGFTLNIRRDKVGTTISFCAYGLLIIGCLLYFFQRNSAFRLALGRLQKLKESALLIFVAMISMVYSPEISAMKIPEPVVNRFSSLQTLHNGRVTSLVTVANDFVSTLTGGTNSWNGHPAEEIMIGYLFDFSAWKKAKIIKVKNKEFRDLLGVHAKLASYADYMKAVTEGRLDISDIAVTSRYAEDIGRFETVTRLLAGDLLKIYPVVREGATEWLTPASKLPPDMKDGEWILVKRSIGLINRSILERDWEEALDLIEMISDYQVKRTGMSPKSPWLLSMESLYYRYGGGLWLALSTISFGLVLVFIGIAGSFFRQKKRRMVGGVVLSLIFVVLTSLIGFRWWLSGHIPLSNGFETMQFMGWLMLLLSISLYKTDILWAGMASLGAGLSLAVAAMSGDSASLGPLMPVLSSPLLCVHVVLVMAAYSLLLMMTIAGVIALCPVDNNLKLKLTALGHTMLYPAISLLAAGIFIGAVWAEMSWGIYWSWDPKEVWALITLLVYSLPAHPFILRKFAVGKFFNIYVVISFLSVLITFFGVNLFLGGMHSYA